MPPDHNGLPVIHDQDGTPRVLGRLDPRPNGGGLMRFAAANAILPRSEWRETDLSHLPVPILDQGQHGSCVGHGSTSAFWFAYLIAGGTVPQGGFSPTSLYALINGGRDQGAIVSDAMDALMNKGLALMADYPESVIYDRQLPSGTLAKVNAERARFRLGDAYHCATFDEIGTALTLGFAVSFGITIRSGFNRVPADGVIPTGGSTLGGHCMAGYGLVKLGNGEWGVRDRNSWGERWGIKGNCILPEGHFNDRWLDAFAVRAPLADPNDPATPPANPG